MYNSEWYQNLIQPPLAPPNWVFPPVWMLLYLMMFGALVLYSLKRDEEKKSGYIFFVIQLFLNLIWSPIFFRAQNIGLAFLIVVFMDIFIFLTVREFYRASKFSGTLLIPYQLWVLFATYLNAGYLILNE